MKTTVESQEGHYGLMRFAVLVVLTLLLTQGCSTLLRLPAVPPDSRSKAEIPGMADVRYYADTDTVEFLKDGIKALKREQDYLAKSGHPGPLPPAEFLAISGGGDDGAFGAGLLVGWTKAGTRPRFKAVTGVSTGALIAPFAFLGPEYDDVLRDVYTNITADNIFKPRNILLALFKDGMADTTPLWELIKKHVDQQMLSAIASEHAKGRMLLIGTTNLDARRGVIWNMGKIAASGHPKSLELFQSIMIASASIPGAFPPVMIDVEADGKPFQEMHVDGGAIAQVFMYPPSVKLGQLSKDVGLVRERRLYIIRNARLDPEWAEVQRKTMSIAGRAISSLIQTQGAGNLLGLYYSTQRDGIDYNLAYIPPTFKVPHTKDFDTAYMRPLFNLAYDLASKGYPWEKTPPGLEGPQIPVQEIYEMNIKN